MSRQLTLELPDDVYETMTRAAQKSGTTPEQWAADRLSAEAAAQKEREAALARLMRHAGAADVGYATGAANEDIDADLARAYLDPHEEQT